MDIKLNDLDKPWRGSCSDNLMDRCKLLKSSQVYVKKGSLFSHGWCLYEFQCPNIVTDHPEACQDIVGHTMDVSRSFRALSALTSEWTLAGQTTLEVGCAPLMTRGHCCWLTGPASTVEVRMNTGLNKPAFITPCRSHLVAWEVLNAGRSQSNLGIIALSYSKKLIFFVCNYTVNQ